MGRIYNKLSRRHFLSQLGAISAGSLTLASTGKSSYQKSDSDSYSSEAWGNVPEILSRIKPPTFPDRKYNIIDYGASVNVNSREPIQKAIDACAEAGGGSVIVPAGDFLVNGPLRMKSGVNLHLDADAVLRFGVNPDDYLVGPVETRGCVLVRWEGVWCYNYSPLIYAKDEKDIAISGKGTIDGQTDKMWSEWYIKKLHTPDRERLYKFGMDKTPLEQRIFGKGHHLAAGTIEFYHCKNILIEGISTRMPLERTIHPVYCDNITVRKVNIQPGVLKARNDDGIDPDSCHDVLIEECTFHNFDDAIALKSGRAQEGWPQNGGRSTENIIIRNNIFHGEHNGVSTGSDMAGGVRNVFVYDCQFGVNNRQMYMFNAKSNSDRGGVVEDVFFKDLTVGACRRLIRMEMEYKNVGYDPVHHPYPPKFRCIHLENIKCERADEIGIDIRGLEVSPVRDITLNQINIKKAKTAVKLDHLNNIDIKDLIIN
jgi:polygalacturonase